MRKITILICAALSVVAMATYYEISLSGDGKSGEENGPGRLNGAEASAQEETHVDKPGDNK